MPASSLFLKAGVVLSALSTVLAAESQYDLPYEIQDTYEGDSFLNGWDFFTAADPTNGFVRYQDKTAAENAQLVKTIGDDTYIGVDYQNTEIVTNNGDGRASVRITTSKSYNQGLYILDLKHMPGSICGTWPAFWSLGGGVWPQHGEIDIIEGVNKNSVNKMVLHTDTECSVNGVGQTGSQNLYNCALDSSSGPSGCDVNDASTQSYGTDFNANGGGVYAMEWTGDHIKIWFFPRGQVPPSIVAEKPDVTEFGMPNANFEGDCDVAKRFIDHQFIFDTTFCGDWAGNVYEYSGCPMYPGLGGMASCKKFVAENPSAFSQAYWLISSFKTYKKQTVVSSSSSSMSSTASSSSSSALYPTGNSSTSAYPTGTSVSSSSSSYTPYPTGNSSTSAYPTGASSSSSSSYTPYPTGNSSTSAYPTGTSSSSTYTPYPTGNSSTSAYPTGASSSSSSYTPYPTGNSSTSAYPTGISSSSYTPYPTGNSSTVAYPTGTSMYDTTSSAYSTYSAEPYPAGNSSSVAYPTGTSIYGSTDTPYPTSSSEPYPAGNSSSVAYPTGTDVYSSSSVYDGYDSTSTSCTTSHVSSSDPYASSSVSYDSYPTTTAEAYDSSSTSTSCTSSHASSAESYDSSSIIYDPYPTTSAAPYDSSSLVYDQYPTTSAAPYYPPKPYGYNGTAKTTTYTTTYVDVCSTGYTTISTTHTAIYYPTPATAYATKETCPPGFTTTLKPCEYGCGYASTDVYVTIPITEYITETEEYVHYTPTQEAYGGHEHVHKSFPPYPTPSSIVYETKTEEYAAYTPTQEAYHEHEHKSFPPYPTPSSVVYETKVVTLSIVPVPASEYAAVESSSAEAMGYPVSEVAAVEYAATTAEAAYSKPAYTGEMHYYGGNATASYGGATGTGKPSASATSHEVPYFTGAASRLTAGGLVGGAVAVMAALL
ncbi:hypothetical protein EJ04DRAFT_183077 [Polyplosphaeria fusca]|uniref:endo-1,3(4)-beta-glucanase n=1 Tax=Polyplosphaeria fusca TaxID=682080 RepID=A0A9P4QYD9_9PLEO|nr:hypothetical protein EJ04DRAFT_183077 [Polyplosphaeria fusca]